MRRLEAAETEVLAAFTKAVGPFLRLDFKCVGAPLARAPLHLLSLIDERFVCKLLIFGERGLVEHSRENLRGNNVLAFLVRALSQVAVLALGDLGLKVGLEAVSAQAVGTVRHRDHFFGLVVAVTGFARESFLFIYLVCRGRNHRCEIMFDHHVDGFSLPPATLGKDHPRHCI